MAANREPIFTAVGNIGEVRIPTTNAHVKSDGSSAGSGADMVYKAFSAGADGSYVQAVRFYCVASAAAVSSVATTLRVFLSTVASPGATTNTDTWLLGEVSAPVITASHSTNATNFLEIPLGIVVPSGQHLHVSQHVAQTTNQNWNAIVIGGDYS